MAVKTYVINIIGAPGVGKTTISALLFAKLKLRGYICEYVQEYAKKLDLLNILLGAVTLKEGFTPRCVLCNNRVCIPRDS